MQEDLGLTVESFTKQSKLFEYLDPPGRQRMMGIAHRERFHAGHVVVREGDVGDSFYVIVQGAVAVSVDDFGQPKQVATLGKGSFFGEMAVITSQPRSATVTAVGDLDVLRFDKGPVEEILKDYPKVRQLLAKLGLIRSEDTLQKMMSFPDEATKPGQDS